MITIVLGIFSEARTLFHAILFLILIDQVTGVVRACLRKEFSWHTFNKVYRKVLLYLALLMAVFVFERYLIETGSIFFTKAFASLIGFQELASSFINVSKATGSDLLEKTIKRIKKMQ
jgi:phage-related holin